MLSFSCSPQVYLAFLKLIVFSFSSDEDAADDNPESQEMLEEQLVRVLTREVVDLIGERN